MRTSVTVGIHQGSPLPSRIVPAFHPVAFFKILSFFYNFNHMSFQVESGLPPYKTYILTEIPRPRTVSEFKILFLFSKLGSE